MKTKKLVLNLLTLAAVVGFVTGCASTGNDKAARTARTLTKSSEMIIKGNTLIGQTLANLNDLISNPDPDLRKQFKTFNSSVNELGSIARDVRSKAEDMKSQGAAYFANWDTETAKIHNEDIRVRSAAREKEVAARFTRISQQYDTTKIAFQPFMSDLRDVQKFLGTDLTAGGLAAIKDVVVKAVLDAVPVKESLAKLSDEFKGLSVSMSPNSGATNNY